MPIFEYSCKKCKYRSEEYEAPNTKKVTWCGVCKNLMEKRVAPSNSRLNSYGTPVSNRRKRR